MAQRFIHNQNYDDRVMLAKQKLFSILKERQNKELSLDFIQYQLHESDVQFSDVVKSGPKDIYQLQRIGNDYYRIQSPSVQNKEQLVQYLKDNQGFTPIDQVILESSYINLKQDLECLEREGRVIIRQTLLHKDLKIFLWKEKMFDSKEEHDQFKNWFQKDYEVACQETIKLINDDKYLNEVLFDYQYYYKRFKSTKQVNIKKLTVVNGWIFPDGLPQESKIQ